MDPYYFELELDSEVLLTLKASDTTLVPVACEGDSGLMGALVHPGLQCACPELEAIQTITEAAPCHCATVTPAQSLGCGKWA